jgi:hypothetical protein
MGARFSALFEFQNEKVQQEMRAEMEKQRVELKKQKVVGEKQRVEIKSLRSVVARHEYDNTLLKLDNTQLNSSRMH